MKLPNNKVIGSKVFGNLILHDGKIAFLIFLIALSLYALLPVLYPPEPSILSDSVEYSLQAESNDLAELFHPHHLLNAAFHRLIWLCLGGVNSPVRVIYLMRWTSHISMALVVLLMFVLARRMGGSKLVAFLISMGFATGCSPWIFGSVAEVVAPSCAAFLFITSRTIYRKKDHPIKKAELWLLGLLFGLAVTWNHIIFIYLPVIWLFLLAENKPKKLFAIIHFTLAAALWLIISYYIVVFSILHKTSLKEFWDFLTHYAQIGMGGTSISIKNPLLALRTLFITQSYSFLNPETLFSGIGSILATAGTAILASLGFIGWVWGRINKKGELLSMIVFWMISLGFIIWWLPSAWDYWVLPWAFLLLGIVRLRFRKEFILNSILTIIFSITAIYNLFFLALPRLVDTDNPYYVLSQAINKLPDTEQMELFTTDLYLCPYARYWAHVSRAYHYYEQSPGILPEKKQAQFLEHFTAMIESGMPSAILVDGDVLEATRRYLQDHPGPAYSYLDAAQFIDSQVYEGKQLDIYLIKR